MPTSAGFAAVAGVSGGGFFSAAPAPGSHRNLLALGGSAPSCDNRFTLRLNRARAVQAHCDIIVGRVGHRAISSRILVSVQSGMAGPGSGHPSACNDCRSRRDLGGRCARPLAHRQQRISVLANQRRSDQLRRPEQWLAKQPLSGFLPRSLWCHGPFIRHRTVAKRGSRRCAVASNIDHRTKLIGLVAFRRTTTAAGQPGRVLCACTLKNCEAVSPPSGQPRGRELRDTSGGRDLAGAPGLMSATTYVTASGGVRCSRNATAPANDAPL